MDAIGIIPARYGSTRFEGKVLADMCGKPMIQHVYEKASQAKVLDELLVAADDQRVVDVVQGFGGKVALTAKGHRSGTDRLTEVVNPIDVKVVVNIQADEPLLHPTMINDLVSALLADEKIEMATLMKKISEEQDLVNPNVVKVVVDKHSFALYFSRAPIPHLKTSGHKSRTPAYYKHIGLYAYTKDFLFTFTNLPTSRLEKIEGLEQLRALENGYRIKVLETKYDSIGVDTPEDLELVRKKLEHC